MIDALSLTESRQAERGFYPTPAQVAAKMLEGIDWTLIQDVLEPSAGKGDLAEAVISRMAGRSYGGDDRARGRVDCVELDENLRHILKGKGFRVVHDDFLTYQTYKQYDLIVMNPPFFEGDKHLLKALSLIRHGGQVVCLLNAETIDNPYTFTRKELLKTLRNADEHSVHDLGFAFDQAERSAQVQIYLVRASFKPAEDESDLMADMRKAAPIREVERDEAGQVIKGDWRDAIVDHYNYELACGIKLISEWQGMRKLLQSSLKKEPYSKSILQLTMDDRNADATVNSFVGRVRYKYWQALFSQPEFVQQLTSNLQTDLHNRLSELQDYEFSVYNILTLQHELSKEVIGGIEKTIMDLFDDWTRKYHWDENSHNRHYFDGWRTNDAFAVNKKVIIPMYGLEDRWVTTKGQYRLRFEVARKLNDIEKVFDYLDGGLTTSLRHAGEAVQDAVDNAGQNRNIPCKYFEVTLYKKGTCHIKFTNLDVIQKFNLFAARGKKWLPPSYGKKRYKDLDAEEKAVIDSFEGEESYNRVLARPDYFLTDASQMLRLEAGA